MADLTQVGRPLLGGGAELRASAGLVLLATCHLFPGNRHPRGIVPGLFLAVFFNLVAHR